MADGWLLKGVQELVDKVKQLESEKKEAAAKMAALERENCELTSIIAQASTIVAEVLNDGNTVDTAQEGMVNPAVTSTAL